MPFAQTIDDVDTLRTRYHRSAAVDRKVVDRVDDGARRFIERSPFAVFATTGPNGTDASPRGGPPGFVAVLDEHRVAFGDLSGNRRLDSFENLLANPEVGLIFLIPGLGETMRLNGRACLTTDPEVLDACTIDGTRPEVAVGIDVAEVYIHCAKALRRSQLWDESTWPAEDDRPRPAQILRDHVQLDIEADVLEAGLEDDYRKTLWVSGGRDGEPAA